MLALVPANVKAAVSFAPSIAILWRMRWAALLAFGLAGCEAAGSQPPQAAVLQSCEIAGVDGTARCGTIRVSESSAGARTIDLRVIVLPARDAAPLPDPILPLLGGPGQGAAELAAVMAQRYAPFRDRRDIVLVDRRGTGASNGLQCEPPAPAVELTGSIFDPAQLSRCRDTLSTRADLRQYTTTLAARDYEAVLDQLGYREVNAIGTSYGSRMALELARQLPRRLRTMTIEAIVPMDFTWPSHGAADADAALDAVIDACAADDRCAQTFPRFAQDIDLAFARLRREPVLVDVRDPNTAGLARVSFGQNDLAYAIRGILYGNDALALPLWSRQAAEGDFRALAQAYVTRARALDAQIALGVLFGVYCAEDVPFVDGAAAERSADGTRLGRYLLDQYRSGCAVWPRAAIDPSFREPVQTSVPALVMAGRRDPVTPPRTAIDVSRTLPRSRLVVWPSGGHGTDGLASPDCRTGIMREFLRTADPSAISIECVAREPARPFVGTQ
jgi:pimeloyl-ACP methyl ester carboxylesterase